MLTFWVTKGRLLMTAASRRRTRIENISVFALSKLFSKILINRIGIAF